MVGEPTTDFESARSLEDQGVEFEPGTHTQEPQHCRSGAGAGFKGLRKRSREKLSKLFTSCEGLS